MRRRWPPAVQRSHLTLSLVHFTVSRSVASSVLARIVKGVTNPDGLRRAWLEGGSILPATYFLTVYLYLLRFKSEKVSSIPPCHDPVHGLHD